MRKANTFTARPYYYFFLAKLDYGKLLTIQPMSRCIRPQQGSPRNPQLTMERRNHFFRACVSVSRRFCTARLKVCA
jgi:hypothetical protein